jgi:hypothetical protein
MNGTTTKVSLVSVVKKGATTLAVLALFGIAVFASAAAERRSGAQADRGLSVSAHQSAAPEAAALQPAIDTAATASAIGFGGEDVVLARTLYDVYVRWYDTASLAMAESGMAPSEPRAAHVYRLLGLAQDEAAVACWAALSDGGRLSDAILNRCVAGASLRSLEYLFPGDGNTSCMAVKNPIPSQMIESAEIPYDLIAAQVLGRLAANDVIAANAAVLR